MAADPHALTPVFALLPDEDRKSVAAVSKTWRGIIQADPTLWPAVVLRAPPLRTRKFAQLFGDASSLKLEHSLQRYMDGFVAMDASARLQLLADAAKLSQRTPHARLEGQGFDEQPDLAVAVLAVLPPRLARLELACRCAGPVLGVAGQRFQHLRRLSTAGNAAEVAWGMHGAATVAPLLEELNLVFSSKSHHMNDGYMDGSFEAGAVPNQAVAALAGASRLATLTLAAVCSPTMGRLLAALPTLRTMRLAVLQLKQEALAATVATLQGLGAARLESLELSLSTNSYIEGESDPDGNHWDAELGEQVQAPPLAGLAPCLHSLDLAGLTQPPPDVAQLSALRSLSVRPLMGEYGDPVLPEQAAAAPAGVIEAATPLAALAGSLTRLRLPAQRLTPALCQLSVLRQLEVRGFPADGALPEVSSLVHLEELTLRPNGDPVGPLPPLQGLTALRQLAVRCSVGLRSGWKEALCAAWTGDGPAGAVQMHFLPD